MLNLILYKVICNSAMKIIIMFNSHVIMSILESPKIYMVNTKHEIVSGMDYRRFNV